MSVHGSQSHFEISKLRSFFSPALFTAGKCLCSWMALSPLQQLLICVDECFHRPIKHEGAEIRKYVLGDYIHQMFDWQHVRPLLEHLSKCLSYASQIKPKNL
jgi:hypothetical protein